MPTLDSQIACVRRELKMRKQVYASQVRAGTLAPDDARREYDAMQAVLDTLLALQQREERTEEDRALDEVALAIVREVEQDALRHTLLITVRQNQEYTRRIHKLEHSNRLHVKISTRAKERLAEAGLPALDEEELSNEVTREMEVSHETITNSRDAAGLGVAPTELPDVQANVRG